MVHVQGDRRRPAAGGDRLPGRSYDVWAPGAHTGTFRGNTLAMAAGAATLRFVARAQLAERAARARRADGGCAAAGCATARPRSATYAAAGLMIGVELVDPDGRAGRLRRPARGARAGAPGARASACERGLIVELGGRHGAVVRLLPPLIITDEQVGPVLERLADAIAAAPSGAAGGRRDDRGLDAAARPNVLRPLLGRARPPGHAGSANLLTATAGGARGRTRRRRGGRCRPAGRPRPRPPVRSGETRRCRATGSVTAGPRGAS